MEHKSLAGGGWNKLSFFEQMANIGSEVERALKWKSKNNQEYADLALNRALELIDLTVADERNKNRLSEILRTRETLADFYFGNNDYRTSAIQLQKYFFSFNFAARATVAGF
jgi:hypothetical protein